GKGVTCPAQAQQDAGRAAFHLPLLDGAVLFLDIDVQPGVRVHPLHLADRAFEAHGLGLVELRVEGAMGGGGQGHGGQQAGRRRPVLHAQVYSSVSRPSTSRYSNLSAKGTHLCSSACASSSISLYSGISMVQGSA